MTNVWNGVKFVMVAAVLGLLFIRVENVGGYYWYFTVYLAELMGVAS